MRDTFRTLWRKSGVDIEYAEYFMGHVDAFDKYGYDKTYRDERDLREKYRAALPYLNLINDSAAYGLVDKTEYENTRMRELEAENEELKRKMQQDKDSLRAELEELRALVMKKIEEG